MWLDGMTGEELKVWIEVKDGTRLFIDLPEDLQRRYIEIEALNLIEDQLKLSRQGKAFGYQGPDSR